jgi:methionyl-tRNA formyltransferase
MRPLGACEGIGDRLESLSHSGTGFSLWIRENRTMRGVRIVYLGTPEFAGPSLRELIDSRHEVLAVVAQPDRPSGRGLKMHRPPVAELALRTGLPLMQPSRIDAAFLDEVRRIGPDLGVVVAYGKILPPSLLEIPRHGFINVHASLLPKYRGAAPIQRAIAAGERITGVTIMRVDEQLDHGPMLSRATLDIGPDELAPSLFARLAEIGGRLLVETIDAIEEGRAIEEEQDHDAATLAPKISKEEGRIRWSSSVRQIYDSFRAFHPWPGMHTVSGGEVLKVVDMRPLPEREGEPGEILEIGESTLIVAAVDGVLELRQLQRAGRKAMPAAAVARALQMKRGERFE